MFFLGFHSTNRNIFCSNFAFCTWSSLHTCNTHHVHARTEIESTHSFQNGNREQTARRCREPELKWQKQRKETVSLYYILHQIWPSSSFILHYFLSAVKPESELCRAPSVTFSSWFSQPTRTSFIDRSIHKNTELPSWISDINSPRLLQPWTKIIHDSDILSSFSFLKVLIPDILNVTRVCFHFTIVCHQTSKEAPLRITTPHLFLSAAWVKIKKKITTAVSFRDEPHNKHKWSCLTCGRSTCILPRKKLRQTKTGTSGWTCEDIF